MYTVPQGNVLVYYDKQSVNGDDIRGFIDLRKVISVKDAGVKVRAFPRCCFSDPNLLPGTLMQTNVVSQNINRVDRSVIEIVTGPRTFVIAPDTINKTLSTPAVPRLQFILGWPVPEPVFEDEVTSELPDDQVV